MVMENNTSLKLPVSLAYENIKEAIIRLKFEPGEHLVETKLAEWLAFSKAPVREALLKLESEGLIERVPFKGCRVTLISREQIRNAFEVRAINEGFIIEKACNKINDSELEIFQQLICTAKKAQEKEDTEKSVFLSKEFHRFFINRENNPMIVRTLNMIDNIIERARYLNSKKGNYYKDSIDQHMHIVALIQARKAEKAAQAMREHIMEAGERLNSDL